MPAEHTFSVDDNLLYLLLCIAFGVAVGATELIARYKDEPFRAVRSIPGLIYMSVNGGISAAAYFLLVYYRGEIFTNLGNDKLITSIAAGFGAMVIMRSKLFSFKSEGGESYAIGPDAVLTTILNSVDREIDRLGSARRQKRVDADVPPMVSVAQLGQAIQFIRTSLASYQNLTNAEKEAIGEIITSVEKNADLSPRLKLMAISFGLMNISGEKNYKALMKDSILPVINAAAPAPPQQPSPVPPRP